MTQVKCHSHDLLLLNRHIEVPLPLDAIDGMDRDGENLILIDGFIQIIHLQLDVIPPFHFLDGTGTIAQTLMPVSLSVTLIDIKDHFPGLILPLFHSFIHKSSNRHDHPFKVSFGQLHGHPVHRH